MPPCVCRADSASGSFFAGHAKKRRHAETAERVGQPATTRPDVPTVKTKVPATQGNTGADTGEKESRKADGYCQASGCFHMDRINNPAHVTGLAVRPAR
jgi:hypothetical protein